MIWKNTVLYSFLCGIYENLYIRVIINQGFTLKSIGVDSIFLTIVFQGLIQCPTTNKYFLKEQINEEKKWIKYL